MSFLLIAALAFQSPADQAVDAAVEAYSRIKTARATFEQTITNPLTGSTLSSRGTFEQQRPNLFAFRFTEPKGDAIVSDGRYIWVYLPSSTPGQVLRAPVGRGPAGSLDLIGEFFSNPRERYSIADAGAGEVGGRPARVVRLTPKSSGASFTRARVWIDTTTGALLQFEAEEVSGITRRVRITSFETNAAVSAQSFVFKPPKGVRVVESAVLEGRS
jgi:outer membrane lipoprotein carrier protein